MVEYLQLIRLNCFENQCGGLASQQTFHCADMLIWTWHSSVRTSEYYTVHQCTVSGPFCNCANL